MTNTDELRALAQAAIKALLNYEQADMDGVIVKASRQAIHEVTDALNAAHAEIDRLREAVPEWQTMDTAPRDGTRILIASGNDDQPDVVFWDAAYADGGFYQNSATAWLNGSSEQMDVDPTHWMPLPTPPAHKSQEGGE